MLDTFEDEADRLIASISEKIEPALSTTKLADTQKLIIALDTVGMSAEKSAITEKETALPVPLSLAVMSLLH